jgi:RNA polymerase sigma-70 factor, ECF subfamily
MDTVLSFRRLMKSLRSADPEGAAEVVARFGERLKGLAHRRLDPRVRAKIDPEDVAQAVFEDFLRRCAAGEFELRSWERVWALLSVMAVRRCAWEGRWYTAARRDVRRELPDLHPIDAPDRLDTLAAAVEAPDQDVLVTESFARVMDQLTIADREVVRLAMAGQTVAEISNSIGRTQRSIYRVLQSVRELLSAQHAEHVHMA